jgi:hypothetical protein
MKLWLVPVMLMAAVVLLSSVRARAGETTIVLRDYLQQSWTNELLTYPFSASKGACDARSITLTGPHGPVPAQLIDVVTWPDGKSVKTAKLAFVADLAPLATATYTVRYGTFPMANPATDLAVTPGIAQVELATKAFGARVLLGACTFNPPVVSTRVPGPVLAMRMADGTWFGGSRLYGDEKVTGYTATLLDSGPVLARAAIRYTYANGNTLDVTLRMVAGDNTLRCTTRVAQNQPTDGLQVIINRNLPPLTFAVMNEARKDRPEFTDAKGGYGPLWANISLKDYTAPATLGWPPVTDPRGALVTTLTPWEDWFGSFTQARIRLKLENATRELQIRSIDPGAWVEPLPIEAVFSDTLDPDPAKGIWLPWEHKLVPLEKAGDGTLCLRVNNVQGVRIWSVSDCLSVEGMAMLHQWTKYKPESAFPAAARPTISTELDRVKDYVLEWPGDVGTHPRLFISQSDLQQRLDRQDVTQKQLDDLLVYGKVRSAQDIWDQYMPNWSTNLALAANLLSRYAPEIAEKTQILTRLRQALGYELYGVQFGCAGNPAPILYDGVIDSPAVPEAERKVLRARMAYYAYRLADPAVWSAERGYCSGNQNMTVTWEISRGITACAIPTHPMAKVWYRKAEQIMEYFLNNMVGPAGEWPESMGDHGRQSVDMLVAFAVASTHSGLHDYVNDPRMKRLIVCWAKMETPRDPRPRGGTDRRPRPGLRYMPAMGRDRMGGAGGTCGVIANALRKSDPALSAELQWSWLEEGGSESLSHLGAFAWISSDKNLPAKQPAWMSEVFPTAGAMFRHGLGTPDEHQMLLYSGDHWAAFYPSHTGSFPNIFAFGVPVAGTWPGPYADQDELMQCHVALAHGLGTVPERQAVCGYTGSPEHASIWKWPQGQTARFGEHEGLANVSSFSALPRQDYAAVDVALRYPQPLKLDLLTTFPEWPPVPAKGAPPVDWRRQVLFLKDDDPAKVCYYLIRDNIKGVNGPQPTMWQMWTVSELLDVPEKVTDVNAVLAAKPGNKILPYRELHGDRFTAIGQLGVDVEYYVAAPTATPRYTLRWGTEWAFEKSLKLVQPEYQDLLHLQMPGDGAYYVAFFPRKRGAVAPAFSTLGNGAIIKVTGDFGTDYGFLSAPETTASGEGATFTGTAASVQDRAGVAVLSLGAKGSVAYKGYALTADVPASVRVAKTLTVELPATIQPPAFSMAQPFPGGTVTLTAPGRWALAKPAKGVTLKQTGAGWVLTLPRGVRTITLLPRT